MPATDELKAAAKHDLILCERVGDTLVITPLGDHLEFAKAIFEHELGRIRRLASNESVRNIVCDFSRKSYFSQELVVPLLGLRDHIRTRGRFVTCGMSEQMSKMFEHSESGTHILQFPNRQVAIGQIADLSLKEAIAARLRQYRRFVMPIFVLLFGVLAVIGWYVIADPMLNGSPAEKLYRTVADAWSDVDRVVHSNPKKANWNGLKSRLIEGFVDPIASLRAKENKTAAELAVIAAASHLQAIGVNPRDGLELRQDEFIRLAEEARLAIEQEDEISLEPLKRIELPAVNQTPTLDEQPQDSNTSNTNHDAPFGHVLLGFGDGVRSVMKDAGCEGGACAAFGDRFVQVVRRAGAA